MIKQLEAKYTVFDSIEDMLSPNSLSNLEHQTVNNVQETSLQEHGGLAGARISYIDTNVGRYVLKRMSKATDYLMLNSNDTQGRSITVWQYGLLDQLLPDIQHKIIACAKDGDEHAILMHDLTGFMGNPLSESHEKIFIDVLARIHATFWENPSLNHPELGLILQTKHLRAHNPATLKKLDNQTDSPIPEWIFGGWENLSSMLDSTTLEKIISLRDQPEPLISLLHKLPKTLIHGECRDANVAYIKGEAPIVLDWQYATYGLMTYDLAWFFYGGINILTQNEAVQYYRDRLEGYLETDFDDTEWQIMVDVAFAIAAMWSIPFVATFYEFYEDPTLKEIEKKRVFERAEAILNLLKWL